MSYPYKNEIHNLVKDDCWSGFFRDPEKSPREFPLRLSDCIGRADFCYEFEESGKLFIEDDDAPRAINNLIKYWRWCLEHHEERPIVLIHIIGDMGGIQIDHCQFLKTRMEKDLTKSKFRYHIIQIEGKANAWATPESWLAEVRKILSEIASNRSGQ
ncbi:hypothetical protein [Candidatus Nitrospira allomarina]|uniref:Uncharacterized protein n=1 Tax=Candidatus Nitrospira allomarina TaxID=3020900 RepID=A0AA96GEQ2_9BACT|nr:hypothetical protein [Candidatus Nitrospira allomarina]WNM56381.1 hypothetical protein PP769_10330 [Candidatus Nitrospira allomarina]